MGAGAIISVILQNLPMVFTDISLGKKLLDVFKAHGVDVDAEVADAMTDQAAEVKKLLAS
jgi:hypothetical protein